MKTIETTRLLLRRPLLNDLEALEALYADPAVPGALNEPRPQSKDELRERLKEQAADFHDLDYGLFSVVAPDRGEVIGRCGLIRREIGDEQHMLLACAILPAMRRQGYAAESMAAVRDHALELLGYSELFALVDEHNHEAKQLAEALEMRKIGDVEVDGRAVALYKVA